MYVTMEVFWVPVFSMAFRRFRDDNGDGSDQNCDKDGEAESNGDAAQPSASLLQILKF